MTRKVKSEKARSSKDALSGMNVDGTAHVDISTMSNMDYPAEIMEVAKEVINLGKIEKLHKSKKDAACRKEGVRQVEELLKNIDRLSAHHDRDVVHLLMLAGDVLNKLKELLPAKDFSEFKEKNFGINRKRRLELACQLAEHRDDIKDITSCGEYRCLEFIRYVKVTRKSYKFLAKKYKFPDTTKDPHGTKLKKLIDALINEHRLTTAGVDVDLKEAKAIAEFNTRSITVTQAKGLKEKLDDHSSKVDEQKELLDEMIEDKKLDVKKKAPQSPPSKTGVDEFKSTLDSITRSRTFTNSRSWVKSQKGISDTTAFQKKLKEFLALAEELKNSIQ